MIVPSCASWLTTENSSYGYRLAVVAVNISSPELCSSASAVYILIFSYFLLVKEGLYDAIINQTVFTLDMFQRTSV